MKNIWQQISSLTQSVLTGGTLWLCAASAQAGPPVTGSITFSPIASESIPALGSTMLILLSLLLAFIAFLSFRRRQNGVLPVIAGALALASLASAGGGVSLLHKAYAGGAGGSFTILDPAGETKDVFGGILNRYTNDSGVTLRVGPVNLPPSNCLSGALEQPGACGVGSDLADGDQCEIDCGIEASDARLKTNIVQIGMTESGLPWYQFRYINDATVYEGVMAQDVITHTPNAVHRMSNGYLAVDYAMLGLAMRTAN